MLGLTGFLGLTQISQIPRCCFVGGKSHRLALWVGLCGLLPWGCLGLALTDLFFGPFRPFRPIGQIGRIGHFKKIIREICGICVRAPWEWGRGRVTKLQKIVLFEGCFKNFEKKCGKSCYIKKFLQSLRVNYKK